VGSRCTLGYEFILAVVIGHFIVECGYCFLQVYLPHEVQFGLL
jgi:hypothetical protein